MPRLALPLLSLALLAAPAAAQTYTIVDLGTLGGTTSQAHGINAKGWIVGESLTKESQDHAFVYHDGKMFDVGVTGGMSIGYAVNETGQTGGCYFGDHFQAFVASDQVADIGTLGASHSSGFALNARGHAVGDSYTKNLKHHAFLWDGKEMHDLGTLGGSFSAARGVNANDVVVGWAYLPSGMFHAYAGGPSGLVDLGTLGGSCSAANAVNDAGAVCGYAYLEGNQKLHACLWIGGKPRDLGVLTAGASEALALNGDASTVVGRAQVPSKTGALSYHAFAWNNGTMRDLNDLVSPGTGWLLEEATGVNDAGQIVGSGTYQGQRRAFLLEPGAGPAVSASALPTSLSLASPLPNPARSTVRFSYGLPRDGRVSLRLIDASGRLVRDLAHEWQPAGMHELTWNLANDGGRAVGSGVYYARLQLEGEAKTTTVQVLR